MFDEMFVGMFDEMFDEMFVEMFDEMFVEMFDEMFVVGSWNRYSKSKSCTKTKKDNGNLFISI